MRPSQRVKPQRNTSTLGQVITKSGSELVLLNVVVHWVAFDSVSEFSFSKKLLHD